MSWSMCLFTGFQPVFPQFWLLGEKKHFYFLFAAITLTFTINDTACRHNAVELSYIHTQNNSLLTLAVCLQHNVYIMRRCDWLLRRPFWIRQIAQTLIGWQTSALSVHCASIGMVHLYYYIIRQLFSGLWSPWTCEFKNPTSLCSRKTFRE